MRFASLVLLAGAVVGAVAACSPAIPALSVDLKTDLRPGVEFDGVRTTVGTTVVPFLVSPSGDFTGGVRVAELDVMPGELDVRVELLSSGLAVDERVVRVELHGSYALTVVVARTCRSVHCPGPSDLAAQTTCAGGRCVDPRCTGAGAVTCPAPQCGVAGDCTVAASCDVAHCVDTVCLSTPSDALCAAGERCDAELGCVLSSPTDAGPPDAGPPDAGPPDAGPPDAGPPDAGPAGGDTCTDPIVLDVTSGSAHYSGDLAGYAGNYTTACSASGALGSDVVFAVDVGSGAHDLEAITGPSARNMILGVSTVCAASADTFFDCHDDQTRTNPSARLILHRPPVSRVYLLVQAHDTAVAGTFTLDVTLRPAADTGTCAGAIDLTTGGKVVGWSPRVGAGTGLFDASCDSTSSGLEEIFLVSPDADGVLRDAFAYTGPVAQPLALFSACSGPQLGCAPPVMHTGYWAADAVGFTNSGAAGALHYLVIDGFATPPTMAYSLSVSP